MATLIDGRNSDWTMGWSSGSIGYSGRLTYDSITRSGNTVTISNLHATGWFSSGGTTNRVIYTRTFSYPIEAKCNGGSVSGSWSIGAGTYYEGTVFVNNYGLGNLSFNVGASETSKTVEFKLANDSYMTATITFPANQKYLNVNVNKVDSGGNRQEVSDGTIGKFDEYIPNNNKIGDQVSDQVGWNYDTGSTYKINNVTEQSADWYYTGSSEYSGTLNSDTTIDLDFKAVEAPTGLDAVLVSRAWNQIVAKSTITSFGAPSDRSGRYVRVYVCKSTDTTFTNYYQQETLNATATGNKTFTTSTTPKQGSPDKIIGCMPFKIAVGAHNGKKWAGAVESTVYYLPPAPMASVTLDETTLNGTSVTFKIKATGKAADNTNNITGAKVNLQFRYSTDGGTTYTAWSNKATNYTPNEAKTFTFGASYNTAIKVQVRQATYQDTTQVTSPLTLDIAAVHPVPKDPRIWFAWDELDRTFTATVINQGNGGDIGDSTLQKLEFQMSYNSDFSSPFVNVNPTTMPYVRSVEYLKPLQTVYVRARITNNWDLTSNWVVVSPTVPRPLWGLVKDEKAAETPAGVAVKGEGNGFTLRNLVPNSTFTDIQLIGKKPEQSGTPTDSDPVSVSTVTGTQTITLSDGDGHTRTFTVNLGSIELNSFVSSADNSNVDRTDRIYKNHTEGVWYLHKETLTYTLDGTNTGTWAKNVVWGGRFVFTPTDIPNFPGYFMPPTDTWDWYTVKEAGAKSTHYLASNTEYNELNIFNMGRTSLFIKPSNTSMTVADYQTWLTNNPVTFYLPYVVTSDTQITDANLISQLNALEAATVYKNTTFSVSGSLAADLSVEVMATDQEREIQVRDMVKVKTDNTVSTRDWIEGTSHGKKRIVKT